MQLGGVISIGLSVGFILEDLPLRLCFCFMQRGIWLHFFMGLKVSGVCSLFVSSDIRVVPSMKKL